MLTSTEVPCQQDPELWFSTKSESQQRAKQFCGSCTQRAQCLQDCLDYESLAGDTRFGIFGGLTPEERTQLRARRA